MLVNTLILLIVATHTQQEDSRDNLEHVENLNIGDHIHRAREVDAHIHLASSSSRLCLQQILEQVNAATLLMDVD